MSFLYSVHRYYGLPWTDSPADVTNGDRWRFLNRTAQQKRQLDFHLDQLGGEKIRNSVLRMY
ncbi:hypothetical protein LX36DRAFT_279776 [Colletotrichum falcatum]|nr:hypothetical protein LX36DRAFT_279776 [Colletotrichum falcatum]